LPLIKKSAVNKYKKPEIVKAEIVVLLAVIIIIVFVVVVTVVVSIVVVVIAVVIVVLRSPLRARRISKVLR